MASPAEMNIVTRTPSKFCAKGRAVQPPILFLALIVCVIIEIIAPWPELIFHLLSVHYSLMICSLCGNYLLKVKSRDLELN